MFLLNKAFFSLRKRLSLRRQEYGVNLSPLGRAESCE